jgi:pyrimidine operon attenuation protein/uracil phosphoribosyltransferase
MKRELFDKARLEVTLLRLAHEVLEKHPDLGRVCMLGLQPRGVHFSRRMQKLLAQLAPSQKLSYGELDATFFRDDFRRGKPLLPNTTSINFVLEDQTVILVDDVLFTGRTVRAALDAMLAFGRPRSVELMVLIDRKRMRELPIEAYYSGIGVDTLNHEKVFVQWQEAHGTDSVRIESNP